MGLSPLPTLTMPTLTMPALMLPSGQIISIALLSFLIGVLVCLLCGLYLLPAVIRAQTAAFIRDYSNYVQCSTSPRVIMLQGPTQSARQAGGQQPPGCDGRTSRIAPASLPLQTSQLQGPHDNAGAFQQIYEHNLALRESRAKPDSSQDSCSVE